MPRHEYIIIFSKGQWKLDGNHKNCDLDKEEFMKYTRSVWVFTPESRKKVGHPAPFPEELPYRLIKFYSYKGDTVLDMFAGSGTVGLVAKKLNRNFILIDNSIEYCKLAEKRIKKELQPTFFNKSEMGIAINTYEKLQSETQKISPSIVVAEKRRQYRVSKKCKG